MLALYRFGRQADALAAYREARRVLDEELGLEPSPALQRLEKAILNHDPELEAGPAPIAAVPAEAPEPLVPEPALGPEVRKVVTVLVSELGGPGVRGFDPERRRRLECRYRELVSPVLERSGATVEGLLSVGVLAVFGIPTAHEDEALRAVRAAIELRDALADVTAELERDSGARVFARVGIATGEVVTGATGTGRSPLSGEVAELALGIAQLAAPGGIVLDETTRRLVRDAVRVETFGESAWRLLELVPEAAGVARRVEAPLVGRKSELAQLRQAFDRAAEQRTLHLFTVLGPGGIGKSRLVQELVSTLAEEATVLSGRCLSYGDGVTFWPLREVVRQAVGQDLHARIVELLRGEADAGRVADRVGGAIGAVPVAGSAEEIPWAFRKLFEALARERPLVLVFEDVHWAEPTLLDLVDHLADWTREAPILLLCLARPELLEERPTWGGGKHNATSILLESLTDDESELLIDNLAPRLDLPSETRALVKQRAGGNPLFLEQMLAYASEGGAATLRIPPTIQALLIARLDRLDPDERTVIERAAVVGQVFYASAVTELCPEELRPRAGVALLSLMHKDLITPERSDLPKEEASRFRHILIRDAAYAATTKETRADLHERFAAWLDERSSYLEVVGYHLEQAHRNRAELGPLDERAGALAAQAAWRLAAAGRDASDRGDSPAAVNLLGRAAALLPEPEPTRFELLLELAEALMEIGELTKADEALTEVIDGARVLGEQRLELHARILNQYLKLLTDPEGRAEQARREAELAIPLLEELGADRALARVWRLLGFIHLIGCHSAEEERALERALAHAERAGDTRERGEILSMLVFAIAVGPTPVADAIRRLDVVLENGPGEPKVEAATLELLAWLHATCGRFAEARELSARGQAICDDFGMRLTSAFLSSPRAKRHLLADDPRAAEQELRADYESLAPTGEKAYLSGLAGLLASALYDQERYEEAGEFSRRAQELAAREDIVIQIWWRGVSAKLLARSGDLAEAEALACEGVELAATSDWLWLHGDACMDLAEVLRMSGRPIEARAAVEEALQLYERKGTVVSAGKARAFLGELATACTGAPASSRG